MPDPASLATEVEEPPASFCRIGRTHITSAKCSSKTAANVNSTFSPPLVVEEGEKRKKGKNEGLVASDHSLLFEAAINFHRELAGE